MLAPSSMIVRFWPETETGYRKDSLDWLGWLIMQCERVDRCPELMPDCRSKREARVPPAARESRQNRQTGGGHKHRYPKLLDDSDFLAPALHATAYYVTDNQQQTTDHNQG